MPQYIDQLHGEGYAIVRGFFGAQDMRRISEETDRTYAEGLKHHATYRDRNLLFEVLNDPRAGRRVVLQAHWMSWINPYLEAMRRDPRYLALLEPLLGADIKQISHQIHWKPPGAKYTYYRYHQDARFRNAEAVHNLLHGTVTCGLAIDPQTRANGALRIIPRSHLGGYLGLSDDGAIMTGETPDADLVRVGLDPATAVTCEMEPGDLLLWTLYTVHGSQPNTSTHRPALHDQQLRARRRQRPRRVGLPRRGVDAARRRAAAVQVRGAARAARARSTSRKTGPKRPRRRAVSAPRILP